MIDVDALKTKITALRNETVKNAITPEVVGAILHTVADMLSGATTDTERKQLTDWIAQIKTITQVFVNGEQGTADRNNINITLKSVSLNDGSTTTLSNGLVIKQATTDRAGAMRAQQVTDLNAATKNIAALQTTTETLSTNQTSGLQRVAALEAKTQTAGLPHIYCEVSDNMLFLRGIENVDTTKYVPYLFRWTTKQNHNKNKTTSRQRYGPKRKGWHVNYDASRIKVGSNGLVTFNTLADTVAYSYKARYTMGKFKKYQDPDHSTNAKMARVGFGKKTYDIFRRSVIFKFAIGFAPEWTDKKNPFDLKTLTSSLATFRVDVQFGRDNNTTMTNDMSCVFCT